jgi:hypothetical protein
MVQTQSDLNKVRTKGLVDEKSLLRRKILLKGQALKLIRIERKELRQSLALLDIRESFLKETGPGFDRVLSQKLDCVNFLLGCAR